MSKLKYFLFFIFTTTLLVSCHKDPTDTYQDEIITKFTAQVYQEIETSIVGYVYDENNQPVENATVATYSTMTKTNKHGVFVMKNTKADQQGTYIKVVKDGYMLGSDFVYPLPNKVAYGYIKLLKLDNTKSFEGKSGGIVNVENGGKIIFPADAIINKDGEPYSGKVSVTAKYLHPNNNELANMMPGGLIADAANGNTVVLGTLGMMAVELRGTSGQKLNLKQGSLATIEFPAVTSYKPSQINLWYFDEDKGRWKEEGIATLEGDKYIAKVSHFSFWNCDAPFPLIEVCGRVLYEDGTPVKNTTIIVQAEGLNTGYGMTNEDGKFCGKMPKGKKLNIIAQNFNCNQMLSSKEVGPFENNTLLDEIIIKKVPTFKISGKLHCNTNIVKEGILMIKVKDYILVNFLKEDGRFDLDLTSYICGESVPVSIFGFDNVSSETSETKTFTTQPTEEVLLNVCASNCDFAADIKFDCIDKISVDVSNGSGNYRYKWQDNPSELNFIIEQDSFMNKTFCVTVTDINTSCEKVFCKKVEGRNWAGIELDCETGQMFAFSNGNPVSYIWIPNSTTNSIFAQTPGNYCVTITNSSGCTASACKLWTGIKYIASQPTSCSKGIYNIESSPFSGAYYQANGTNMQGQLTYPISLDVFLTGFFITVTAYDDNCRFMQEIKLPQLIQGLTTSVVNTTCGTCNDGKINIVVNNNATCFECKIGNTKIFSINDLNNDLTALNNNSQLAKGEYYVVVTDTDTGCYIAYNKVKIQ